MNKGDKVQFIKDVTWEDLIGPTDIHEDSEIAVQIWEVGTVVIPGYGGLWDVIVTRDRPEGFGFAKEWFEVIPSPSQQ